MRGDWYCGLVCVDKTAKQQALETGMESGKDKSDDARVEECEPLTEADEMLLDAVWEAVTADRAATLQDRPEGKDNGKKDNGK